MTAPKKCCGTCKLWFTVDPDKMKGCCRWGDAARLPQWAEFGVDTPPTSYYDGRQCKVYEPEAADDPNHP